MPKYKWREVWRLRLSILKQPPGLSMKSSFFLFLTGWGQKVECEMNAQVMFENSLNPNYPRVFSKQFIPGGCNYQPP